MEATILSETDLLAIRAKTDHDAADALYRETLPAMLAAGRYDADLDEDDRTSSAADSFLRAIRTFEAGRAPFLAFLVAQVKFDLLSLRRKMGRKRRSPDDVVRSLDDDHIGFRLKDSLLDKSPEPIELLIEQEGGERVLAVVKEILADLFPDHPNKQAAVVAVLYEGYTAVEADAAYGLGPRRTENAIARFRGHAVKDRRLRAMMEDLL